jgi:hypothetical protein|tara:strand:+ start:350 stop:1603 length:1254 start_codon:yes stop_codon:yes gene_type:complete
MKRFLPLLILPLLIWVSCEEESPEEIETNLITATFKNGFCLPDFNSFLVVSDEDGEILADTSFQGDVSFNLRTDENVNAPDKINITLIRMTEWGTLAVTTNLSIDKGANWTWDNPYHDEPESQGSSYYTFSNVSENNVSRVVLSSKGFYYRTTVDNTSSTYSLNHYHTTEDVSIMAYKEDGTAIYTILEDVQIEQTYNVDLSTFLPATYKIITNSTGEECDNITLHGYDADDSVIRYNRHRFTDRGYVDGGGWNANGDCFVNYPSEFSKFGTHITVGQYAVVGEKDWYQRTFGDIPESVEKINADISVVKSDPLDFEVSTSGVFDQCFVQFDDSLSNSYWTFYVNPNISSGSILIMPSSVYAEYPELSGAYFKMRSVGVSDYLCVDSYQEWLELYFSTDGYYGDFCPEYRSVGYRVY